MKRFIVAVLAAFSFVYAMGLGNRSAQNMKKLMNAEFAISEFYVDSVNGEKLVEDAIRGMLDKLDPHSSYTTADETRELQQPLQGKFSGIGISFNMKQDTLYVISLIAGGPSERVGMLPGDRIVTVNDSVVAGVKMTTNDIRKRLMGPKGTLVNVGVKRPGEKDMIHFGITRDEIPIYSVDAAYMADPKTGYIRISRFAESTGEEFAESFNKLKKKGMTQLILDLSDNGGGYLNTAVELANTFLRAGETIVYTEGNRSPRYDAVANGKGGYKDGKLVVLVNQYSASASEILAGAVQDWDRGVVVGRRTFGKGLVQRPFTFEDGSMMRLTTARYYTPSGRCIQKPYKMGEKADYAKDVYNRYKDGELQHADSIHVADSLKYTTLKNERIIYGGGGIIPDVFVPIDTTEYSDYYGKLNTKGVFIQYTLGYIDKNRDSLKAKYKDVNEFDAGFKVSDEMIQDLISQGEKAGVKYSEEQYKISKNVIDYILKSLVARDVFDQEAFTIIYNKRNDLLKEGLRVINDDKLYNSLLKSTE